MYLFIFYFCAFALGVKSEKKIIAKTNAKEQSDNLCFLSEASWF